YQYISGFDVILMRCLCQKSGYATFTSTLMSGGVLFRGFDRLMDCQNTHAFAILPISTSYALNMAHND
ncbi:hypothetical protein, partial [Psychrobacter celer]|uniref:hypothetical protein n=1 Tax=Psychrobacter celer TaxID=306572 RepID=UPI003FD039A3